MLLWQSSLAPARLHGRVWLLEIKHHWGAFLSPDWLGKFWDSADNSISLDADPTELLPVGSPCFPGVPLPLLCSTVTPWASWLRAGPNASSFWRWDKPCFREVYFLPCCWAAELLQPFTYVRSRPSGTGHCAQLVPSVPTCYISHTICLHGSVSLGVKGLGCSCCRPRRRHISGIARGFRWGKEIQIPCPSFLPLFCWYFFFRPLEGSLCSVGDPRDSEQTNRQRMAQNSVNPPWFCRLLLSGGLVRSEVCGAGQPAAGVSAPWRIHPQALGHSELGAVKRWGLTRQPGASLRSSFLPGWGAALAVRRACAPLAVHDVGMVSDSNTWLTSRLKEVIRRCFGV